MGPLSIFYLPQNAGFLVDSLRGGTQRTMLLNRGTDEDLAAGHCHAFAAGPSLAYFLASGMWVGVHCLDSCSSFACIHLATAWATGA